MLKNKGKISFGVAKLAQLLIIWYRKLISDENSIYHRVGFHRKHTCGFYPSCSEYSYQAFGKYGFWKGLYLSIRRISRCHPWQKNHIDPLV